jgi:hypothetical protein
MGSSLGVGKPAGLDVLLRGEQLEPSARRGGSDAMPHARIPARVAAYQEEIAAGKQAAHPFLLARSSCRYVCDTRGYVTSYRPV